MQSVLRATFSFRHALLGFALIAGLTGCHTQDRIQVLPISARMSSDRAELINIAHVQAQPEYRKAQAACRNGDYRKAAGLLAQLSASTKLSPVQLEFCRKQQQIVLDRLSKPSSIIIASTKTANPNISTHASSNCGPRALLIACQLLGVHTTLPELSKAARLDSTGVSMLGLQRAAQSVGLHAEGMQVSREVFAKTELPAIIWINTNHYVILRSFHGEGANTLATIHDPNKSFEETMPQEKILQMCGGYMLLLKK